MTTLTKFNRRTRSTMQVVKLPITSKQALRLALGFTLLALALKVFEDQE